jgi:hypothetical protein
MSEKSSQELIEYIDLINDQLTVKYGKVVDLTRYILKTTTLDDIKRSYLEWSLAHLHADMVKLHEDLKNMQKSLRDKGE